MVAKWSGGVSEWSVVVNGWSSGYWVVSGEQCWSARVTVWSVIVSEWSVAFSEWSNRWSLSGELVVSWWSTECH